MSWIVRKNAKTLMPLFVDVHMIPTDSVVDISLIRLRVVCLYILHSMVGLLLMFHSESQIQNLFPPVTSLPTTFLFRITKWFTLQKEATKVFRVCRCLKPLLFSSVLWYLSSWNSTFVPHNGTFTSNLKENLKLWVIPRELELDWSPQMGFALLWNS